MNSSVTKQPLISVIVPVYNIISYLPRCVESLRTQTYENLEILLIDDGSTDETPALCDRLATEDERIRVFHKKNGGPSSARNFGLQQAGGEYVGFVDSDDYLKEDMVEVLYHEVLQYDAEIATAAFESFFEDESRMSNPHNGKIFVYTKEKALDCFLFNDYLTPCVCGKLYSISLWKSVRFPEGKLFEDQFTTYKLIDQCKKIVFDTTPRYYYRKRVGSIGHSSFSKRTYDLNDAIHEEYDYIHSKYGEKVPNIATARITWEVVFINMMIVAGYEDISTRKEVQKFAKKNMGKIWNCEYISKVRKIQLSLFAWSFPVYVLFYHIYKKKHPVA